MIAATKLTPVSRIMLPKVKRGTPVSGSIPMVATNRPKRPAVSPLSSDPPPMEAIAVIPRTASAKYSAGPKFSATRAKDGAAAIKTSVPKMPPKTDEASAMPSALPASPRRAIG